MLYSKSKNERPFPPPPSHDEVPRKDIFRLQAMVTSFPSFSQWSTGHDDHNHERGITSLPVLVLTSKLYIGESSKHHLSGHAIPKSWLRGMEWALRLIQIIDTHYVTHIQYSFYTI